MQSGALNSNPNPQEAPAELDPTSASVGLTDPHQSPPASGETFLPYPSFGTPADMQTTFSRDGIPIPRDLAIEMLHTLPGGNLSLLYASQAQSTRVIGRRDLSELYGIRTYVVEGGRAIQVGYRNAYETWSMPIFDTSWSIPPALLGIASRQPQKPGEISEPTNSIRIIDTGGDTEFERNKVKVLRKIEWMVNSACNEAFKRWGLATPYDLVKSGKITLSSTKALQDSSYNSVLGIPDEVRRKVRDSRGPARTLRNNTSGQVIIFFGADAFDPAYLDEAVPHEFIHASGQGRNYSLWGWLFGGHDLSGFNAEAYADIMANCKDH